jgi:hypothetical protein
LTLPNSPNIYSVNISSYCPGLVDTSLVSLNVTSRLLQKNDFNIISTVQTTYTPTIYAITLNLPLSININFILNIVIPVYNQSLVYCNNGSVSSNFVYPNLNLSLQNPYPNLLNIYGLMTPVSTKPILISVSISSVNNNTIYYYANNITLAVSLGK